MRKPDITIGYAQSLDGRIATASGDSRWISAPETLRMAHELRRDHDAVLVGVGTVLADDPALTVRLVTGRSPLRVVLDSTLRTPADAQIVRTAATTPTLVAAVHADPVARRRLEAAGADVVEVPAAGDRGRVDLAALLPMLAERGIGSVYVEGGRSVITAFLAAGLAVRVIVTVAPFLIGSGIDAIGDLGVRVLAKCRRPESVAIRRLGGDVIFDLRFSGVQP